MLKSILSVVSRIHLFILMYSAKILSMMSLASTSSDKMAAAKTQEASIDCRDFAIEPIVLY